MQGPFTNADADAEAAPAADPTETDAQHAVAAATSNDPFEVWALSQAQHLIVALDHALQDQACVLLLLTICSENSMYISCCIFYCSLSIT